MIIDCISDLHGFYPKLDGGDLLIIAGDLTSTHRIGEFLFSFITWLSRQDYRKKIIVAGNHDVFFDGGNSVLNEFAEYLCDSGTEFDGLKIWGSPWTKTFPGMNPHCKAFTVETDEALCDKWSLIPGDTDILITHSPPHEILDLVRERDEHVGSESLRNVVISRERMPNLKLHVFGHIHSWGGKQFETTLSTFVNASYVNENYEPMNKPVRIIL